MRKLTGFWRHVVTALSVMLVLFQLYTAGFGVFPDIVQRSVHLFFVLTMLFLLMPANKKKKTDTVPWYDVVLSMICMVCTGYMILIYEKILWDPSQWINSFDKICAVLLTILILEGSRRAVGLTFPIMAAFSCSTQPSARFSRACGRTRTLALTRFSRTCTTPPTESGVRWWDSPPECWPCSVFSGRSCR